MRSSYIENNYGYILGSLVSCHKPMTVVDCGLLDGYSLISMSLACKSYRAKVYGYDLFEDYEFKHGTQEEIQKNLDAYGLWNVKLIKEDAVSAAHHFENNVVDFLHIDISNDGITLEQMFNVWTSKIKKDGLVVFEGGSEERDNIEWMTKYKKIPISVFKNDLARRGFEYITLAPFPSMTVCRKVK